MTLLCIIVMISHIQVKFYFKKDQANDKIAYHIKALLGIIRLQFEVPVVKFKGVNDSNMDNTKTSKAKNFFRHFQNLRTHVYGFSDWYTKALSKIKCIELSWNTKVGIGDAPVTAITTGLIWALKTTLLGFIFRKITLRTKLVLDVTPCYHQKHFTTELVSELKVRHFFALLTVLELLIRIMKIKGGLKMWIYTVYHLFLVWRNKKKQHATNP